MNKIRLEISYKGTRNYIHGTSLYDEISKYSLEQYGNKAYVNSLVIRKFAHNACDLIITNTPPDNYFASCRINLSERDISAYLVETDEKIKSRTEYDEHPIQVATLVKDKSIIQQNQVIGYSPIEILVSMTKYLHYQIMPELKRGIWVFVQLDIERPLEKEGLFTVSIEQSIPGRFSASSITQAGNHIGFIRFSVGQS